MPNKKGTLQPAPRTDNVAVKPEPPIDLWERMEEVNVSAGFYSTEDTGPGFTIAEYMKKFKLKRDTARKRLDLLAQQGKVNMRRAVRDGKPCKIYTIVEEK